MIKNTVLLLLMVISFAAVSDDKEAWSQDSDPEIMSFFYLRQFVALPLKGQVTPTKKFWSGDYWALNRGNINYRWFAQKREGFNYRSPSLEEARLMSMKELSELSPTEKFDLWMGRYDYPLRKEVELIASPGAMVWEGICHGWSGATTNHNEPLPKIMKNPEGLNIPFGSTDIKALLSYYYAYGPQFRDTFQVGKRCFTGNVSDTNSECLGDMNAGAFHVILANRIGIDGKSFVADLARYQEVWNHPILSYDSQVTRVMRPGPNAAIGSTKVLLMRTNVRFLEGGASTNDWNSILSTRKQKTNIVTYDYKLELDKDGAIIGGEWVSYLRPDFLWLAIRVKTFKGKMENLGQLLND